VIAIKAVASFCLIGAGRFGKFMTLIILNHTREREFQQTQTDAYNKSIMELSFFIFN